MAAIHPKTLEETAVAV